MKPKTARILIGYLFFALFFVGFFSLIAPAPVNYILWVLLACDVVSIFVVELVFWRCPNCRRLLPSTGMITMQHCPYCGQDLD